MAQLIISRHFTILFIGGILLILGYAIFEIASSGLMVTWKPTNIIFNDEVTIQPNKIYSSSQTIEDNIMVLLDIQSFPQDNLIKLEIYDKKGLSILDIEFQKKLVISFITKEVGSYSFLVSNFGKEPALIKIELSDVPFINQKGLLGFDNLNQIKIGLIMMLTGMIGLCLGTFFYFKQRKKFN